MSAILLGIDGTGPMFDGEYHRELGNSFVNYIVRRSPAATKLFMRGPGFDGVDMGMIVGQGYEFVHLQRLVHPDTPVLLTGYSRGGAGVIGVAQKLADDGVQVAGMVLFDPVDRAVTGSGDEIPNNVLRVYQARRIPDTFSRVSFNNCGNVWHQPTRCWIQHFWATHGGMGGVPWRPERGMRDTDYVSEGLGEIVLMTETYGALQVPWHPERGDPRSEIEFLAQRAWAGNHTRVTFQQDAEGAHRVWAWMEPQLQKLGFLS